jgi:hypothetical protein
MTENTQQQALAKADRLSAVISKLPPYVDFARVVTNIGGFAKSAFQRGVLIREAGFVSATADVQRELSGNTTFLIASQNGREIGFFSKTPDEREVIFDKGTVFLVVDAAHDETTGVSTIVLVDVELPLGEPEKDVLVRSVSDAAAGYLERISAVPPEAKLPVRDPQRFATRIAMLDDAVVNVVDN